MGRGRAGESKECCRAICVTGDMSPTLDFLNFVDRSVIILSEVGGGEDFEKSYGFQGNGRDRSSPKEYYMRSLEQ